MKTLRTLLFLSLFLGNLFAQTFALPGDFVQQFFDNNGLPLNGGFVVTCVAGTSCNYPVPGNPQASYTDSTGLTTNPNPVPLDSSGRANIWLNTALLYKIRVVNSAGVTIKTIDNVSAVSGGGGSTTNYWTLSGSDISNNNGGGAGNVNVGAGLNVGGNITLQGTIKLRDAQSSPNYAILRANSLMTSDVTWSWPAKDAAGVLTSDGAGNLSFAAGGGGSGTPGGANTNVQFNNSGSFGGSGNFTWSNASQLLNVTATNSSSAGINVSTGFMQSDAGFLANGGTAVNYNAIQAPGGGMAAKSFTATKYIQAGNNNGTPTVTNSDTFNAGALYYDTGTHALKLFNDSAAWVTVATGGATPPGGANTQIQFNSSGSFGGSANLTYSSQLLTSVAASSSVAGMSVSTGFMQADAGFLATAGTATNFNAIQAPGGGMFAKSFTALNYIQTGNTAGGAPSATTNDSFHPGAMYFDITLGAEQVYNGTSWVSLSGGGGGGSPGGPNTAVEFNNSGAFGGSANFTWNNAGRLLTVSATNSGSAGIAVSNGFVQADAGFLAPNGTAVNYNSVQAPGGGMAAKSFTATKYIQTGNSTGIPPLTTGDSFQAGAMYWDNSGVEKVYNGSTWVSLATGGVASLNSLTGGLTIAGTANEINVSPVGSTITLSTPQQIATSSAVNFGSVTTSSFIASNATGASLAFQGGGGTFQVNGAGAVSASGVISSTGGGGGINNTGNTATNSIQTVGGFNAGSSGSGNGVYQVNGVTVIDSARNIVNAGTGTFASAVTMNGGFTTGSSTNSTFYVGSFGNLYLRTFSGTPFCGGVQDGWVGYDSTNNILYICQGGVARAH